MELLLRLVISFSRGMNALHKAVISGSINFIFLPIPIKVVGGRFSIRENIGNGRMGE
jgi:hypothetical protein